tara:strand:+ start:219 stop:1472 length:1254 start_codon:yes stop_codon:yes gene_type:complete
MPKIVTPLGATQIKNAKPNDNGKDKTLSDGGGLQLRIRPNGAKIWVLKYSKPFSNSRTNLGLGTYPAVSLDLAREKARDARILLAQNIDPKTHREHENQLKKDALENTFGVMADKWYALKLHQVKPETAEHAFKNLQRHILPKLTKVPLDKIIPKTVTAILQPIANKGSLETVKRLCRSINEIMRLGIASGLIEVNYLADITKVFPAPKKKHMATIKPERLPELMEAIVNASIFKTTKYLLLWQLHTMTRPIEAASARWEDIDIQNGIWTIPAERMKMDKPHIIVLSKQSLALLNVIRSMCFSTEYLFSNHRDINKHASSQSANTALRRMGFEGQLVSHGLRSIASTTLNEKGFDFDIIESALAHQDSNSVRRAYNHAQYIERRRVMMNWWSEHIERCSKGDYSLMTTNAPLRLING